MWDTACAASKYGLLFCVVDGESSRRQAAARGAGIPSMPRSGKGRFI